MSERGWRLFWLFQSGCILLLAAIAAAVASERDWAGVSVLGLLVAGEIVLLAFRRKVEAWVEHG